MRSVAIVAVLFSILLLAAGAASAVCEKQLCYSVYKECDNEFYEVVDVAVCLNDHYGMIHFNGIFPGDMDLVTFGFASHLSSMGWTRNGWPQVLSLVLRHHFMSSFPTLVTITSGP